eukprot:scaffold232687_cov61-Attheya_sp.AAC.1
MAEDLNSCHRRGDACGCYSVNGMARLVAIGMGVCPIALAAGGKSLPDSVAGFLLSPAVSGPQYLDGIGGLLSAENDVEVVAWLVPQYWPSMLEEVPSLLLIFLRAWLPCGLIECWRLDVVLHGHGCDGTEVRALAESWFIIFFSRLRLLHRPS